MFTGDPPSDHIGVAAAPALLSTFMELSDTPSRVVVLASSRCKLLLPNAAQAVAAGVALLQCAISGAVWLLFLDVTQPQLVILPGEKPLPFGSVRLAVANELSGVFLLLVESVEGGVWDASVVSASNVSTALCVVLRRLSTARGMDLGDKIPADANLSSPVLVRSVVTEIAAPHVRYPAFEKMDLQLAVKTSLITLTALCASRAPAAGTLAVVHAFDLCDIPCDPVRSGIVPGLIAASDVAMTRRSRAVLLTPTALFVLNLKAPLTGPKLDEVPTGLRIPVSHVVAALQPAPGTLVTGVALRLPHSEETVRVPFSCSSERAARLMFHHLAHVCGRTEPHSRPWKSLLVPKHYMADPFSAPTASVSAPVLAGVWRLLSQHTDVVLQVFQHRLGSSPPAAQKNVAELTVSTFRSVWGVTSLKPLARRVLAIATKTEHASPTPATPTFIRAVFVACVEQDVTITVAAAVRTLDGPLVPLASAIATLVALPVPLVLRDVCAPTASFATLVSFTAQALLDIFLDTLFDDGKRVAVDDVSVENGDWGPIARWLRTEALDDPSDLAPSPLVTTQDRHLWFLSATPTHEWDEHHPVSLFWNLWKPAQLEAFMVILEAPECNDRRQAAARLLESAGRSSGVSVGSQVDPRALAPAHPHVDHEVASATRIAQTHAQRLFSGRSVGVVQASVFRLTEAESSNTASLERENAELRVMLQRTLRNELSQPPIPAAADAQTSPSFVPVGARDAELLDLSRHRFSALLETELARRETVVAQEFQGYVFIVASHTRALLRFAAP